ncbi:metallophosphoesterase [Georgenia sp. MJ206]|uniref:metallophosphoesterase n=1 Tax=Georgenia wangjunii TaxID=3117730 RepID=UPI002F26D8EB
MSRAGRAAAGLALSGLGAIGWGLLETRLFALRSATVPALPAGARPVRLLHLSDMHMLPGQRRKQEWVRSLAELEPDVVITTGDNMAHPASLPAVLHALEPLLARPGAFVLGSNDYFAPSPKNPARYLLPDARGGGSGDEPRPLPAPDLVSAMRAAGWLDLTNARGTVDVAGLTFSLVGVDDPHLDRDRFPAADGAATPAADLHVGVTHAPYTRVLDAMVADRCALVLAGHTHGGQLCVPGYGALVTNCDLDTGRASGLHGWPGARPDAPGGAGSAWLNVSAGLGTSPYAPLRFACRPEASLLTLVGSDR